MIKLTTFKGLNCYNNSVISIINTKNINFNSCFYNLWSENNFNYQHSGTHYASKKLFKNLEELGVFVEIIKCNKKNTECILKTIPKNQYFIIGMDSFYIPWNDIYQFRHDQHYFIAKKSSKHNYMVYDATYDKTNLVISYEEIIKHAFEIEKIHFKPTNSKELTVNLNQELKKIKKSTLQLEMKLINKIDNATNKNNILYKKLVRYVDALINNRYMFKKYINQTFNNEMVNREFMTDGYFLTWMAVKNGIIKMSVLKDENTTLQVKNLIHKLMLFEQEYANNLLIELKKLAQ